MTRQELLRQAYNIACADMIVRFEDGLTDNGELWDVIQDATDSELLDYINN